MNYKYDSRVLKDIPETEIRRKNIEAKRSSAEVFMERLAFGTLEDVGFEVDCRFLKHKDGFIFLDKQNVKKLYADWCQSSRRIPMGDRFNDHLKLTCGERRLTIGERAVYCWILRSDQISSDYVEK